jgi:hypothetical protein
MADDASTDRRARASLAFDSRKQSTLEAMALALRRGVRVEMPDAFPLEIQLNLYHAAVNDVKMPAVQLYPSNDSRKVLP